MDHDQSRSSRQNDSGGPATHPRGVICPECGEGSGSDAVGRRKRWQWIVPSIAVLAVLIAVVFYTVETYTRAPIGASFAGYPGVALAEGGRTLGDLASDPESGDTWVRLLMTTQTPWQFCPAQSSVQLFRVDDRTSRWAGTSRRGWPIPWLETTRTVSPTGLPHGSAAVWRGPSFASTGVSWFCTGTEDQVAYSVSFVGICALSGFVVVAVLVLRALAAGFGFRKWTKAAIALTAAGLTAFLALHHTRGLPIFYNAWPTATLALSMADVHEIVGSRDADARIAQSAIDRGVDPKTPLDRLGLTPGLELLPRLHRWPIGWPVAFVSTLRFRHPDHGRVSWDVSLERNGQLTLWRVKSPGEQYHFGYAVHLDAALALAFVCWIAYRCAWLLCYGFDRWRSRRWIRRGFCGGCGYDLR